MLLQGGITCGAINEARKSSKAFDEHVIINFRDKNAVIARFGLSCHDLSCYVMICHEGTPSPLPHFMPPCLGYSSDQLV